MVAAKNTIAVWCRGGETVNTGLEPELYFFKSLISFLLLSIEIWSSILSYLTLIIFLATSVYFESLKLPKKCRAVVPSS